MPPEKPLPLPDWAPPWWWGAGAIALWAGAFCVALLLWVEPFLVVFLAIQTWQAPAVGLVLLVLYFWQRLRWSRCEASARALGLSFRPRVYEADLGPYRQMTLFALTDDCRRWAGYRYEGVFDGEEVEVFDYGFVGKFRTTDERTVTWPGRQTVFLLPGLSGVPDFHLAPSGSDWGDLIETRLWSLDAGDAVLEVEMDDHGPPATLRGQDERAVKRLFRRGPREEMGLAAGWTIECRRGVLMLYRDKKVIGPADLARYLDQAVRVAAVLREVARGLPPVGTAAPLPPGRDEFSARLDDNVRPAGPENDQP